jgi:hypothetical protein
MRSLHWSEALSVLHVEGSWRGTLAERPDRAEAECAAGHHGPGCHLGRPVWRRTMITKVDEEDAQDVAIFETSTPSS